MIQEQAEAVVREESRAQLLCEALFLTGIKYLSRKEAQKARWGSFRGALDTHLGHMQNGQVL